MKTLSIETKRQIEVVDITEMVQGALDESGIRSGLCVLYVPHTTAGITINEGADPDVMRDLIGKLSEIIPLNGHYLHREGNAAAHIKTSILGSSEVVIIENGRLVLGTWQSIFLCEFDGPRHRRVLVKMIGE